MTTVRHTIAHDEAGKVASITINISNPDARTPNGGWLEVVVEANRDIVIIRGGRLGITVEPGTSGGMLTVRNVP